MKYEYITEFIKYDIELSALFEFGILSSSFFMVGEEDYNVKVIDGMMIIGWSGSGEYVTEYKNYVSYMRDKKIEIINDGTDNQ